MLPPHAELEVPPGPRGWVQRDRRLSGGTPQPAAPGARPHGCSCRLTRPWVQVLQKSPTLPISPRSDCRLSGGLVEKGGSLT